MKSLNFLPPVYVKHAGNVLEIASVGDALDYLEQQPSSKRGVVWDTVVRAMRRANDGFIPAPGARQAFESYARLSRVLSEDAVPAPSIIGRVFGRSGVPL